MAHDDSHRIQLDRVAFYGRTLAEYVKIFDLDLSSWHGCTILDCPAGASSFVAEAHVQGIQAVACDPLYGSDVAHLINKGEADIQHVMERVALVPHLFKWEFYPSINALQEYRTLALRQFQDDYPHGLLEQRYITAELPRLPFEDRRFDLVLSGHFLFTYSDRFDYAFHRDAILELVRVSAKTRMDIHSEIRRVPFEFQRGSNQMLRLIR